MRESKITFRVSDDLLERVDTIDESRSEIMREALRSYLDGGMGATNSPEARAPEERKTRATFDDVLRGMVEEVVKETVEGRSQDNVNVTVNIPDGDRRAPRRTHEHEEVRADEDRDDGSPVHDDEDERKTCAQCGEKLNEGHVYCPNCGEKAARRVFCDCGDELRTDWSFCPSCGRRTPTSHALNR